MMSAQVVGRDKRDPLRHWVDAHKGSLQGAS